MVEGEISRGVLPTGASLVAQLQARERPYVAGERNEIFLVDGHRPLVQTLLGQQCAQRLPDGHEPAVGLVVG